MSGYAQFSMSGPTLSDVYTMLVNATTDAYPLAVFPLYEDLPEDNPKVFDVDLTADETIQMSMYNRLLETNQGVDFILDAGMSTLIADDILTNIRNYWSGTDTKVTHDAWRNGMENSTPEIGDTKPRRSSIWLWEGLRKPYHHFYGYEPTVEEDTVTETIAGDKFLHKFLKNTSDSLEMNVDGSTTAVSFKYTVPANEEAYIARCNIYMEDANPSPSKFGGLTALTNGLIIRVLDAQGSTLHTFNDGATIKSNSDFHSMAGVDVAYTTGQGADAVSIRWTLQRQSGGPSLVLREDEAFEVVVQDNLTGLDKFRWSLQGQFL